MDAKTLLARFGGRTAAGILGLAAAAAVVGAAFAAPADGGTSAVARTVTPVPAAAQAVCPGSLLSVASDTSATTIASFGSSMVNSAASSGDPKATQLASPDDTAAAPTLPEAFQADAQKGKAAAPLLAAAESQTASEAEVSGLAATTCAEPDSDAWLVGGATSLGSTSLLVLGNPGGVAATVDLDIYTEQGTADGPGAKGILVQPRSQRVIALSGIAPDASAMVVHVSSAGAAVTAHLEQNQVTGVTPQGVDWTTAGASPAKHVVIPGAVVDTTASSAPSGTDDDDTPSASLRVFPTGDSDAKLTISAQPESGSKGGGVQTVSVTHGVVSEVPLDKLGTGTFTVSVDSSTPVVAAVHAITYDKKAGTDFAWYGSAAAVKGPVAVPVAAGPSPTIHIANTSAKKVVLHFGAMGGSTRSITVNPSSSAGIKLGSDDAVQITDAAGVYLSVSYKKAGQLASYPVYPPSASASPLTVYRQ